MKSFTDLEQSKKLAEILPLESADMQWFLEEDYGIVQIKEELQDWGGDCTIPCWSLTALLNALPRIDIEKEICSDDTYEFRVKAYIGDGYIGDWYNNPVDACYEMILKLYEQKFL